MNELTRISRSSGALPAPIAQRDYHALRVALSAAIPVGLGHEIPADRALNPDIRRALEQRAAILAESLRPVGSIRAQQEIAALLGNRGVRGDADDMAAMLEIYGADLADLPLFALSKACADFRQGRVGDTKWAPNQGEIRVEALKLVHAVAKEKREIETVLRARIQAPISSPERRAQVAAHVAETQRQLGAFSARAATEDRYVRRHKYWGPSPEKAAPVDHTTPVKLSTWVRGTMGPPPSPIEDAPMREDVT